MPRKKHKQPSAPPLPPSLADTGPETYLQRLRTREEVVEGDKNGSKLKRRYDAIDAIKGLSPRQHMAARKLREAYEATAKGPPAIKEIQVDSSPKPDANIDVTIDRLSWFVRLHNAVPPEMRYVVDHVVLHGRAISDGLAAGGRDRPAPMADLTVALDLVANEAGL